MIAMNLMPTIISFDPQWNIGLNLLNLYILLGFYRSLHSSCKS